LAEKEIGLTPQTCAKPDQRQTNCRKKMKHQHRFDPMTPRLKQVATILGMIDDLGRVAHLLDDDIASKGRTGLPLLASLTSRRQNLRQTIVVLEKHLADIRSPEV
jgi:hypothetical protein